jgi:large subunit ribosomal protein L4
MNITFIQEKKVAQKDFSGVLFNHDTTSDKSKSVLKQIIVAYRNGQRQGTKAQKNRGSVTGSTKKPWKQKGTGRARAGDVKSPIWKGGGVTFAQRENRDYSQKVNKKTFKKGMCITFSLLAKQEDITVIEDSILNSLQPKTKDFLNLVAGSGKLGSLSLNIESDKVLFIHSGDMQNFELAVRNIPNVKTIHYNSTNPYTLLLANRKIIITESAMNELKMRYDEVDGGEINE